MGGEITTAHVAIMVATLAVVVPIFTALAMFLLTRLFGGGDDLRNKVHALELAQVAQYATRNDLETFRDEVRAQFSALRADVNTMMKHYSPNASFPS
jgi:hypothetical protein